VPWSSHHSERSRHAEQRFLTRVRQLGAQPAADAGWNGGGKPPPLICAAGHACAPAPSNVLRGQGICKTCAGNDTDATHPRFLAALADAGAKPAPKARWAGVDQPYLIVCAQGHHSSPRPHHVLGGSSLCTTCAGRSSAQVHERFLSRVTELSGRPAGSAHWNGVNQPYRLVCAQGHRCSPHPHKVLSGGGLCRTCASRDSDAAHAQFLARVAQHGAKPAPGANWRGTHKPYALVYAQGHTCAPHPSSVRDGADLWQTCAGRDPETLHAAFLERRNQRGGRPAPYAIWQGSAQPYPIICTPVTMPRPTRTASSKAAGYAASAERPTTASTCSGTRAAEPSRSA
jgi:hypothetical protein